MEPLEKNIEREFGRRISEWANRKGYNVAHVKFEGARAWPDRILTWGVPDGPPMMVWIEWKRPGEKPRPMQLHVHKQLRAMGHEVYVCDNVNDSMELFTSMIERYYRDKSGISS